MLGFLKRIFVSAKGELSQGAAPQAHLPGAAPEAVAEKRAPMARPHSELGFVHLNLRRVLEGLPAPLKASLRASPPVDQSVPVPLETIAGQLATGRVCITFRELKDSITGEFFQEASELDASLVPLPLDEVLARIGKTLYQRRTSQKVISVPDEVTPIFGPRGQPFSGASSREMPAAEAADAVGSATEEPLIGASATPETLPMKPQQVASSVAGEELRIDAGDCVEVELSAMAQKWPSSLKEHVEKDGARKIRIPVAAIEPGLKRGKIELPWREVRSWISVGLPCSTEVGDEDLVELPLSVIAPLYFSRGAAARSQKKIAVSDDLPPLFAPAAAPGRGATASEGAIEERAPETAGAMTGEQERSGQEVSRGVRKDPEKVMRSLAELDGVTGALLTTSDGLFVAGTVPEGSDREKVSAFVPQMFGRMVQYAEELGLGQPRHLEVKVEEVPLLLVKLSCGYIAVLGQRGKELSISAVDEISAELEH